MSPELDRLWRDCALAAHREGVAFDDLGGPAFEKTLDQLFDQPDWPELVEPLVGKEIKFVPLDHARTTATIEERINETQFLFVNLEAGRDTRGDERPVCGRRLARHDPQRRAGHLGSRETGAARARPWLGARAHQGQR